MTTYSRDAEAVPLWRRIRCLPARGRHFAGIGCPGPRAAPPSATLSYAAARDKVVDLPIDLAEVDSLAQTLATRWSS